MIEDNQKYNRISKHQVETIKQKLSEREKSVLLSILRCHFLTTAQIKRLHYKDSVSDTAAMRAANRGAIKLRDLGLIVSLNRRIGGVRAGSGSFVWSITTAGLKVLSKINRSLNVSNRKRIYEPTSNFLTHALAVSEVYLQLTEVARREAIALSDTTFEPDCWRAYSSRSGVATFIKPDLYAVISAEEYEDYYFFEIDNGTESPSRIVKKCMQYIDYYNSGTQQKKTHVFPYVVWIVPDEKRKKSLSEHIRQNISRIEIFLIITIDQLKNLIINGAGSLGTVIQGD